MKRNNNNDQWLVGVACWWLVVQRKNPGANFFANNSTLGRRRVEKRKDEGKKGITPRTNTNDTMMAVKSTAVRHLT